MGLLKGISKHVPGISVDNAITNLYASIRSKELI